MMTGSSAVLKRAAVVLCAMMACPPHVPAWNATGHRAISFLAYSGLYPRARERASAILKIHPDFAAILSKGVSADPVDVARNSFVTASTWPDLIRNDPRFFDKPPSSATPLPGFPDMGRHQSWHFINTPIPAEFKSQPIDPENALNQIKALSKLLRRDGPPAPEEAFALPWILHLITDVHQPLHGTTRFRKVNGTAEQDKGGNNCFVTGEGNLHSLWDGLLGSNQDEGSVARLAASLQDHQPAPKKVDTKPEVWIAESVQAATATAYNFPGSCDEKDHPLTLPADYRTNARQAAISRAALGAYRLAAVLNEKFGK